MSEILRIGAAALTAGAVTVASVPIAIRVAGALDLLDRPTGWKSHVSATPYLGGLAVVVGTSIGVLAFSRQPGQALVLVTGTLILTALGTVDDRCLLPAAPRVAFEVLVGIVVWEADLGWSQFGTDVANLAMTVAWVVAVINAINLLDLMDGVAGAVTAACGLSSVGVLLVAGESDLALAGAALAGGCIGFLRSNAAVPSRIFLGDGGSMPLGFMVAVLAINSGPASTGFIDALLVPAALVLVPMVDMAIRIVVRLRRRVSILTGGPDSTANALRVVLRSPLCVAMALGGFQLMVGMGIWIAAASNRGLAASLVVLTVIVLSFVGGLSINSLSEPMVEEAYARAGLRASQPSSAALK